MTTVTKKENSHDKEEEDLSFLVDAHCHLQDEGFGDRIEEILKKAEHCGVYRFACCGTRSTDWQKVLDLAERDTRIIPGLAWHPWYIGEIEAMHTTRSNENESISWLEELERQLQLHPHAYIGECGLDGNPRFRSYFEWQKEVLRHHMILADRLGRPLTVHCVNAWAEFDRLVADYVEIRGNEQRSPLKIQLHSFSGSKDQVQRLLRWEKHAQERSRRSPVEIFFSLSGTITFPQRRKLREAILWIPMNRLLIETDAPSIPVYRSEGVSNPDSSVICEPSDLILVLKSLCELRNMTDNQLRILLYANSRYFFGSIWFPDRCDEVTR
jgi:TatD DNase family protein